MALVGTFSQYGTVPEASIVKIDDDLPLSRACLLGCGVTTGWGSAVNTADVSPGDTVVVIGFGGIGSGAIQGARLAGAEKIVVVDPVETKRDKAFQFGATHFVTSMPEATALVAELTRGVMADSAILTVGLLEGAMLEEAANIIRKGGAVVMTALARDGRQHADAVDDDVHAVPEAVAGQPLRRGQPTRRHPRACSACTARASCCSTRPSPTSTSWTRSTRATRTCGPDATSAVSCCTTTEDRRREYGRILRIHPQTRFKLPVWHFNRSGDHHEDACCRAVGYRRALARRGSRTRSTRRA